MRPDIVQSWKRSALSGVSPSVALGERYDDDFDPQSRLMRAARAVIDRLAGEVADTATSILLADARARILDRRVGIGSLLDRLDRASAVPGSSFAEDVVGTNGLGTVIEERRPFVVQGPEHFAERLKDFTCVGVPIVNPFNGVLEGILDLTCRARDASPLMLPLVLEAAREVRQLLVAGSAQTEQAMLAAFQVAARHAQHPVVAINDRVVITNAAARGIAPADLALLWSRVSDELGETSDAAFATADGREYDLRVRGVGTGRGAVVELHASAPARRGSRRRRPRDAQLVGRSAAWCRLVDTVLALAADPTPVLFVGDAGAGKAALAAALHRAGPHADEPRDELDAGLSVGADAAWTAALRSRLDDPRGTLVLRHLDVLDERDAAATAALLDRVPDGRPRLLATCRASTVAGHLRALLDRFPTTVTVPPLRERRDDIVDLAAAFARGPADGRAAVLPPPVVRILARHDWPGNVRQLATTVRALTARAAGRSITPEDLPAHIRVASSRPALSRMDEVERDAIVAALRAAGGNRQEAARQLGISRSTLYRKLAAYRL